MVEQGSHHSESSAPEEGEGLSRAHWEVIAKIYSKDPKINRVAKAILDGNIDSSPDSYRQYLGQRHWWEIRQRTQNRTKGLTGWVLKSRKPELTVLLEQVATISSQEIESRYSLDDYYSQLGNSYEEGSAYFTEQAEQDPVVNYPHPAFIPAYSFRLHWSTLFGRWSGESPRYHTDNVGGHIFASFTTEKLEIDQLADRLLHRWMLTKIEVGSDQDVVSLSPRKLTDKAKRVPIEILNDRFKARVNPDRNYVLIGDWEKEI